MPTTSPSTIGLDLEDFRRLGVRPFECRLTVIRSAAARSARTLAEQQLASPSEQVGLQLSRVATSAYRLLDPRQRPDTSQQMFVGRILPIALICAGQTRFHTGDVRTPVNVPFGRNSSSDESGDTEASSASVELDDRAAWTANLHHDDLRDRAPSTRRGVGSQSRFSHPWMLLTIAGLAIGTMLGLATMRSGYKKSTTQRSDATPVSKSLPDQDLLSESRLPLAPKATEPDATEQAAVHPVTTPEANSPGNQPVAMLSESLVEPDAEFQHSIGEPHSDNAGNVGFLPDPLASRTTTDLPPQSPRIDLIDPAISDAMKRSSADSVITEPDASPPERELTPSVTRHSVPEDARVRAARIHLVSLVPELTHSVVPKNVEKRIAEIEALVDTLDNGSADDWTARLTIAELAWLVEDVSQVRERLKTLADNYHVPIQQPLSDSFVAACDLASLPETYQHLLSNGLRLADQLLMSESFEHCKHVVHAIGPLAEFLENESSVGYLEQLSQAADQMVRLAQSTKHMIDDAGEISSDSGGAGILGRYDCLMLRRWDIGLPWLAQVSDARIASVARQEIGLGDTSSAQDLITLSQRWLVVASRSRGRASDSMRLHAIEIMQKAKLEASRLQKLELEKTIDEALELLPPFLRTRSIPVSTTTPVRTMVPEPAVGPQAKNALSGRMKIDGLDIGVQLDYELGVPFTQSILDTIAQRLNRTLLQTSIQFAGRFQLDEPTTVLVSIAPSEDVTQVVRVDGKLLEFDLHQDNAKVSLQAGTHQIDWTIEANHLASRVYLRVHNSASGRRLPVVQPTSFADRRTTLTVGMVRSEQ